MGLRESIEIWKQAFGRGVFPHQMSWFLDLPLRPLIMSANTVANRLPITETSYVLEIGPGSGYYSVEVAKRIKKGRLELYDIQQEMLDICKGKIEKAGINNVGYTKGDGSIMNYKDNKFDAIFMIAVFGEIEKKVEFLNNIKRLIKPGGILSITEHHPDPDLELFPELNKILLGNGFTLVKKYGWRWAYTANYKSV